MHFSNATRMRATRRCNMFQGEVEVQYNQVNLSIRIGSNMGNFSTINEGLKYRVI